MPPVFTEMAVNMISLGGAAKTSFQLPSIGNFGNALDDATKMIEVSGWGREGLKSGDWVMKGGLTPYNYIFSGKWQPGFTNQYASPLKGQKFLVLKSSLKSPVVKGKSRGSILLNYPKYLLGQRIYRP